MWCQTIQFLHGQKGPCETVINIFEQCSWYSHHNIYSHKVFLMLKWDTVYWYSPWKASFRTLPCLTANNTWNQLCSAQPNAAFIATLTVACRWQLYNVGALAALPSWLGLEELGAESTLTAHPCLNRSAGSTHNQAYVFLPAFWQLPLILGTYSISYFKDYRHIDFGYFI